MADSFVGKRVLIVDDDEPVRNALKNALIKDGFEVETAENGILAQKIITSKTFDAILSDIQMPGSTMNGIELLHFVRRTSGPPVILMTGFSGLLEMEEAVRIGAQGFLAKPFRKEDLLKAIVGCFTQGASQPATQVDSLDPSKVTESETEVPQEFCKLNLDDFVTGRQIKHSIYIQLPNSKFVKIAHEGEDISLERVRSYKSKGLKYLFLKKEDFQEYMNLSLSLTRAANRFPNLSREKKFNLLKHSTEVVMEYVHSHEFDQEAFESAKSVVENTISYLSDDLETFDLLSILNSHADHLYAHSLGVSLYGSLIAQQLRWNSHSTLYRVSIAGLMHDIGKKEVSRAILMKSRTQLTAEEIKEVESHPVRGMEILSRVASIPSELSQIILQHHETEIGTGYPSGLSKKRIHPLARLLSVANVFCELVVASPDGPGLKPSEAIERLTTLHGKLLDMTFITALTKTIKTLD